MARGARSSGLKKNKKALRKRVFGPVEQARNERLNTKLASIIAGPKPARVEVEDTANSDSKPSSATTEGASPSLSIAIPDTVFINYEQLPTPPSTPSALATPTAPLLDRAGQRALAEETLFYHLLGAATDVLGFDVNGDLCLAFNNHSSPDDNENAVMQDADAKTTTRSQTQLKKMREAKSARKDSHRHRKATNAPVFKKHPKKSADKKAGSAKR